MRLILLFFFNELPDFSIFFGRFSSCRPENPRCAYLRPGPGGRQRPKTLRNWHFSNWKVFQLRYSQDLETSSSPDSPERNPDSALSAQVYVIRDVYSSQISRAGLYPLSSPPIVILPRKPKTPVDRHRVTTPSIIQLSYPSKWPTSHHLCPC